MSNKTYSAYWLPDAAEIIKNMFGVETPTEAMDALVLMHDHGDAVGVLTEVVAYAMAEAYKQGKTR